MTRTGSISTTAVLRRRDSQSASSTPTTPTATPGSRSSSPGPSIMYEPLALRAPPLHLHQPLSDEDQKQRQQQQQEQYAPASTPFYTPSHTPRGAPPPPPPSTGFTPSSHTLPLPFPSLNRTSSSSSFSSVGSSSAAYPQQRYAPVAPNPRDLLSFSPRHSFSSQTGMMHAELPLAISISASSSRAPSPSPLPPSAPSSSSSAWHHSASNSLTLSSAAAASGLDASTSSRTSISSSTTSNLSRSLLLGGLSGGGGSGNDNDDDVEDDNDGEDGAASSSSASPTTPLTASRSGGNIGGGGGVGGRQSRSRAAAQAISSELSRSRRGVQQVLHWMGRRVGFGYGAVSTLGGGGGGSGGTFTNESVGGLAQMREVVNYSKPRRHSHGGRRSKKHGGRNIAHAYRDSWKDTARSYFLPVQISSLLNFLCAFAIFALGLTFTLKYYLNPDKKALPWRDYCQSPYPDIYSLQFPPDYVRPDLIPPSAFGIQAEGRPTLPHVSADHLRPLNASHPMWPYHGMQAPPISAESESIDSVDPVNVFVGVFTVAQASERRMIIRQTYNSHRKSRSPGTEGVKVRFVMGRPPAKFAKLVSLEMEAYNDIVVLDIPENMNYGKTHAFFRWAAENATIEGSVDGRRPDYVVKADDDSFLMLGEIERRLRASPREKVFWGYLVKKTFMAGECYALSRDLVDYVAETPALRQFVRGAEDKVVAKWLRMHPEREQILWVSERCWIYDHPKANTVYSHGFLFPSTVAAIRAGEETARQASFSTVSTFGSAYRPPSASMSPMQEVEALVESSPLSRLKDYAGLRPNVPEAELVKQLYTERPKREELYRNNPKEYGGTVVVHFIKRNDWFMETALALLGPHEELLPAYAASKASRIGRDKWDI